MTAPVVEHVLMDDASNDEETKNDEFLLILLNLKTTSMAGDCDILQIDVKCDTSFLNNYAISTKNILPSATEVH